MNLEDDLKKCNELKRSLDDEFLKYFSSLNFSFLVEKIVSKSMVLSFPNIKNLKIFIEENVIEKSYTIYITKFIFTFYEIEICHEGFFI